MRELWALQNLILVSIVVIQSIKEINIALTVELKLVHKFNYKFFL